MPLDMGMKEKTRGARFIFACFVFSVGFFTYGRLAFQNPEDNPSLVPFSSVYYNSGALSPEERLRRREASCLANNIQRNVPRRMDGDARDIRDACLGGRVLELEASGGVLKPLQRAVAQAAHDYRMQRIYYYLSGFFAVMGAIPFFYIRAKRFWERNGRALSRFAAQCRDIIHKMM